MEAKHIIFFSSDATLLYKGDVFRCLSLPDGYTIQFRYPRNYVLSRFRDDPEVLKGREGLVVFLGGNDLAVIESQRTLTRFSIRGVSVKDAFVDQSTDQVMVILELKDFIDCDLDSAIDSTDVPPKTFLTESRLIKVRHNVPWIEKVKLLEAYFPSVLFFRVNSIRDDGEVIAPFYSRARRAAFYKLSEESEYSLECTGYDPENGNKPLHIEVTNNLLICSNQFSGGIRALSDTQRFPLTTHSLPSWSIPADLIFYSGVSTQREDSNSFAIAVQIERKRWKPAGFGFLSALAAIGVALSQTTLKTSSGAWLTDAELIIKVVGVLVLSFAVAMLFRLFNKV